jgi:hypothetical protein
MKRAKVKYEAAVNIQKYWRAALARDRVKQVRRRRVELLIRQHRAAIKIQSAYRGHKARVFVQIKMRAHRKERALLTAAATQIQRVARGFVERRRIKRMQHELLESQMEDARQWQEVFDEANMSWFYRSRANGAEMPQPPRTGYTKTDGRLVLVTGKVVDDPLSRLTEEEKEEKRKGRLCVECEEKDASRLCKQCQDRYCTACYNKTHAGGRRAAHVYAQIGPIDCSECEKEVALRWCTSCDDPFCVDCWSLIHLRGKRLKHAYCPIDRKGNVSLEAIGPNGESAGTFKAGQNGGGYGSDYGEGPARYLLAHEHHRRQTCPPPQGPMLTRVTTRGRRTMAPRRRSRQASGHSTTTSRATPTGERVGSSAAHGRRGGSLR